MSKAKTINTTPAPGDEPGVHFAALAVAMPRGWHQGVVRLTKTTERVEKLLKRLPATPENGSYAEKVRGLVTALVDLLDDLDPDPDLEPTLGFMNGPPEMDECEIPEDAEPSLGSFDRMMDQEKSWRTIDRNPDIYGWSGGTDNELDDCDYEDDDPAEESEASGIGDQDGLQEQIGRQDWQPGVFG